MKRRRQSLLSFAPDATRSRGGAAAGIAACHRDVGIDGCEEIVGPQMRLSYWRRFLDRHGADDSLRRIHDSVYYTDASETSVLMFGRRVPIPRRQAAYGDSGMAYAFAGTVAHAQDWLPVLSEVRDRVHALVPGWRFNFVLVNRYDGGEQYMGYHRDDEADLHPDAPIASVTLGAERDFVFQHLHARRKMGEFCKEPVRTVRLHHGSLLLMNAPTNHWWYHALPKRAGVVGTRINLTFRVMQPRSRPKLAVPATTAPQALSTWHAHAPARSAVEGGTLAGDAPSDPTPQSACTRHAQQPESAGEEWQQGSSSDELAEESGRRTSSA